MSDLKISEFRERAEQALDFPDLAGIVDQGRALRRRRVAAAVGALALVVVAGTGIATIATDRTDAGPVPATRPSPAETTPADPGVRTTFDRGEEVLLPGPSVVDYDGVTVHFDVPGESWEWWGAGTGLRRQDDPNEYSGAVFFLPDASARLEPCRDERAGALGSDPERLIANVAPLLDLAGAAVLQVPRVVEAFGGTAVHVQLLAGGGCSGGVGLPAELRGVVDGSDIDPGFGRSVVIDAWHVVVPGPEPASLLVVSWDLDGSSRERAQLQALLDSVRIGRG